MKADLPPCGTYRTTRQMGAVPSGRLVYFHNHGQPGPGVYLPEAWHLNRAYFREEGETILEAELINSLEPLEEEGLYRVEERFVCCPRECQLYSEGLLVQLGYNGNAEPILFVPEWTDKGLAFPEIGQVVSPDRLENLSPIFVAESEELPPSEDAH